MKLGEKIILSTLIAAGLALIGIYAFAGISHYNNAINKQSTKLVAQAQSKVQGLVLYIKGDYLKLKDQAGKSHPIQADDPKTLKGIRIGDNVNVKIEEGIAVSAEKI
ncbi:MAG: hypothetical protein ACREOW_16530 [Thermodesulfobacteriota bacterium]